MRESPKRAARRRWVSSSLVTRSVWTFLEDRRSEEGAGPVGAVVVEPVEGDVVEMLATLEGERDNAVVVSPYG